MLLSGACERASIATRSETREEMGTLVSITLVEERGLSASAALEAAFAEFERIDRLMSTYRPESELSVLNRDGSIEAGEDLLAVLNHALEFHRRSAGAFDVTVQPLLELYRSSYEDRGGPPFPAEIRRARALIDASRIGIEGRRVSLPPGVRVTLDGIAKGYAIDRAIEVLAAMGVRQALVDAGGDVRALGRKGGAPWRVALQNPRDARDHLVVIPLDERAVATSGDYRRYFDRDRRVHHILDPRSGESARALISVTVTAATALGADALATAVFVLGVEEGEIVTSSGW